MGTGCPLPQLTPYGPRFTMEFSGGACGPGAVETTARTSDGADHHFAYMFVGTQPAAAARLRASGGADAIPEG